MGLTRETELPEGDIPGREETLDEPIEDFECDGEAPPEPPADPTTSMVKKDVEKDLEKDGEKDGKIEEGEAPKGKPRRKAAGAPKVNREETGESEKGKESKGKGVKRKANATATSNTSKGEDGKKGPSTFARRVEPNTELGKMKWNNLKEVFNEIIKPKLVTYSVQEDLG